MAYNEDLAKRIRTLTDGTPGLSEKGMFGGLAFLINGNMAVAASGQGGILVRVDPAQSAQLISTTAASPMEMRGHTMPGWLRVDTKNLDGTELDMWVELGITYAAGLAKKKGY